MIQVDPAFSRAPALSQVMPIQVGEHAFSELTCQCAACDADIAEESVRAILVQEPTRALLRCLGRCTCGTITLTTLQMTAEGKLYIAAGDQWNAVPLLPEQRSAIGQLLHAVQQKLFGNGDS